MFSSLLPKSAPFFELLLQQNDFLCSVAGTLVELMENISDIEAPHRKIADMEDAADKIHVTITKHLSQTFITPIDREDILHINKEQEEAIDFVHDTANRLYIFEFKRVRFPMLQLARTQHAMTQVTRSMLKGLAKRRDSHDTRQFRILRNECEMLLSMGLVELHDLENPTPQDILIILKHSQIYDRMESSFRQIVSLGEIIEEAVLKNV